MDFFCKQPVDIVRDILKAVEELGQFRDVDTILDRVLLEARKISSADAGSIFLIRDGQLHFSYVHNDTLFRQSEASRHIYSNLTVPVSEKSIVGYAALTGQTLVIDDAYHLDPSLPYSFNRTFDEESGYRTRSILAIPLTTLRGTRVGVMQLINATCGGQATAFSEEAVQYAPFFAAHASVAIERGIMTRELILRMMKMAEMRDPSETGAHVQRVGAYAAEIYQLMAEDLGKVTRLCARPKQGEEIPLPARITALADVFDALCSRRSYKEPWSEDQGLEVVRAERGRHFDPAVVDAFLSIFDVIQAIREKYRDAD